MSKYTTEDNRSMQLNPNNERYWNVREDEHEDAENDSDRLAGPPEPQIRPRTDLDDYLDGGLRQSRESEEDAMQRRNRDRQQEEEERRSRQEFSDYCDPYGLSSAVWGGKDDNRTSKKRDPTLD